MSAYLIRRVTSVDDLSACLAAVGSHFSPPMPADDEHFDRLFERFQSSRPMMVVAERDGQIVGGVFAATSGDGSSVVAGPVSIDESVRGTGLARRLMQTFEVQAMALGARTIGLGSKLAARGFYERLGYSGKRTGKLKALPLPGKVRDLRVARLQAKLGDLDEGRLVEVDPDTGKVPALW